MASKLPLLVPISLNATLPSLLLARHGVAMISATFQLHGREQRSGSEPDGGWTGEGGSFNDSIELTVISSTNWRLETVCHPAAGL